MSKEQSFVAVHSVSYDHPKNGRVFVKAGQSFKLSDPKTIRELKATKSIRADDGLGDEDILVDNDEDLDEQATDEQLDEPADDDADDADDDGLSDAQAGLQTEPLADADDDGLSEAKADLQKAPPPAAAKKAVSKTAAKKSTSKK